jgi:hypothetical protein
MSFFLRSSSLSDEPKMARIPHISASFFVGRRRAARLSVCVTIGAGVGISDLHLRTARNWFEGGNSCFATFPAYLSHQQPQNVTIITRMASSHSQSRVSSFVESSKSLLQKLSALEISSKAKAATTEATGAQAPTTANANPTAAASQAAAAGAETGENAFDLSLSDCKSTNDDELESAREPEHNHNADLAIRLEVLSNETRELKSKLEKLGSSNRFKDQQISQSQEKLRVKSNTISQLQKDQYAGTNTIIDNQRYAREREGLQRDMEVLQNSFVRLEQRSNARTNEAMRLMEAYDSSMTVCTTLRHLLDQTRKNVDGCVTREVCSLCFLFLFRVL